MKSTSSGELPLEEWVSRPIYLELRGNYSLAKIYHCMSLLEVIPKGIFSNQMTTYGFFALNFIPIKAVQGKAGLITHYSYEDGTPLEVELQNHLFPKKE